MFSLNTIVAIVIFIVIIGWQSIDPGVPRIASIEGYDSNINVDSMVFSDSESHAEKKNRPVYTFPLPLPLESVGAPKKNTSKVVLKELTYLAKLTAQTKQTDERRKLCQSVEQKGSLPIFLKYAGSNGLVYDKDHLVKVTKDVETLAYLLKSYYNRPRPYQLGFLLGKNISPAITADSSSYPCEHTMISKMLAYQLSKNNHEFKEQLHSIAKRIELSRYYGGVNFPSDTVASLKVCDILRDKIKYLDIGEQPK
jgi:hypothetical protein